MRTIAEDAISTLEINRSRFVCALHRTTGTDEAATFIAARRAADRTAGHHCTAYVLGDRGEITRNNDDGEPAGTAGPPMLEVLTGRALTNVTAVVTRHFGGVKLGTGGLIRAYGRAVADAVDLAGILTRVPVVTVTITVPHTHAGRLLSDLHATGRTPAATRYAAGAEIDVTVPDGELDAFDAWIAAVATGHAATRRGATGYRDDPLTYLP